MNIITHDRICLHTGTVPATEKCENIHKDGFHDNADLGLQFASKKVEIMQTSVAAATSAALKSKKRKRLEDGKSARGERLMRSSDTLHWKQCFYLRICYRELTVFALVYFLYFLNCYLDCQGFTNSRVVVVVVVVIIISTPLLYICH